VCLCVRMCVCERESVTGEGHLVLEHWFVCVCVCVGG